MIADGSTAAHQLSEDWFLCIRFVKERIRAEKTLECSGKGDRMEGRGRYGLKKKTTSTADPV